MEFRGFLNNLKDLNHKEKDQRMKSQLLESSKLGSSKSVGRVNEDNGSLRKVSSVEVKPKAHAVPNLSAEDLAHRYRYLKSSDAIGNISGGNSSEDCLPNAASEKELGNEYFKQKKFLEAIECYSRSIAFSPTSVAFANRAMAYLKLKRFEEAENDCTEALNLDDRYVKAYSRRSTARKELGKLKEAMEDADFAVRLEPSNDELRKQYFQTKALYEKEISQKKSGTVGSFSQESQRAGISAIQLKKVQGDLSVSSISNSATATVSKASTMKQEGVGCKHELRTPMQDLASRAASRVMANASRNITAPKSAYEFEVSWRAVSDDCALQAQLLQMIPPDMLPQIFKNALSAPILIDIIRCISIIFTEDVESAISILDNMAKVPRFDMIIMCLTAKDRTEVRRIWEDVFNSKDISIKNREALNHLRSKYCYGEWQDHILGSNGWPNEI